MYLEPTTNTMKKGERMKKLIIAVVLTVGVQNIAHADLNNMGFENGNLTHWTLTPSNDEYNTWAQVISTADSSGWNPDSSKTYTPREGIYFVELNAGAGGDTPDYTRLSRTITINTNQSIAGWAAFIAEDALEVDEDTGDIIAINNDNAYVRLYDEAGFLIETLWSKDRVAVGDYGFTEWEKWSWTAQQGGTYILEYGVTNETDNYLNSRALFDAVPAPNTLLLLGSGLLGLVGIRRKLQ
jgi:hypothetical protein